MQRGREESAVFWEDLCWPSSAEGLCSRTLPVGTGVDWLPFFQQAWCPSASRGTVTATSTWWPTPMWRARRWSRTTRRSESSLGANTPAGACIGRAVAATATTRRRGPACPWSPLRGEGAHQASGAGLVLPAHGRVRRVLTRCARAAGPTAGAGGRCWQATHWAAACALCVTSPGDGFRVWW